MNRAQLALVLTLCSLPLPAQSLATKSRALHQTASLIAANELLRHDPPTPTPPNALIKLAITETIHVVSATPTDTRQPDDAITTPSTSETIRTTAGALADIPRFLQTMPGVMFDTDARNGYMVNGGNPLENLYVVDGVEVPNINHISTANTSGGFMSMIDTDAVFTIKLHKMLYGPQYSGALSSILEIKLREPDRLGTHGDISLGAAGADLVLERSVGHTSTMLTEARKSVINYVTDDIGFGGVPKYSSVLSKTTTAFSPSDTLSTLVLEGSDTLSLAPNINDDADPGFLNTVYTGDRATFGATWLHSSSDHTTQKTQLIFSRVHSTSSQTNAMLENALVDSNDLMEHPATLKYDLAFDTPRIGFHAGSQAVLHSLHFQIAQPNGLPSPYRLDPTPVDASNVDTAASPLDTAAYADLSYRGWHGLELSAGARTQHFNLDHATTTSPRASLETPTLGHAYLFAGAARYSQLPPLPTMLGVASNIALKPITVTQLQAGLVAALPHESRITFSAYRKLYRDYPVSTEYLSLSQADVIDAFGQPFLYLPMTSAGKGIATGLELEYTSNPHSRAFIKANVTSQKVTHQALDQVSRRANFDMPIMSNITGGLHLGSRQRLTARHSFHTGTPYTGFLVPQSQQQARPIYDLTQINTRRGDYYARLDLRYEIDIRLRGRPLELFAGVDNALGRANFYQYAMIPHCNFCGPYELTQQGRMAEGGMTYRF